MEQYTYQDSIRNLDRRVSENFSEITWKQIRPIVKLVWSQYLQIGWTLDEIIEEYKRMNIDVSSVCKFDYIPNKDLEKYEKDKYRVLVRQSVAKMYCSWVEGQDKYVWCDQTLTNGSYVSVDAKKVAEELLMKKFPFFKEDVFYEMKKVNDVKAIYETPVRNLIDCIGDMTVEELKAITTTKLLKIARDKAVKEKSMPKFAVYFEKSGKPDMFLETNYLSFRIGLEELSNKDWDAIVNFDSVSQSLYYDSLSKEQQMARLNNSMVQRVKEYCLTGK